MGNTLLDDDVRLLEPLFVFLDFGSSRYGIWDEPCFFFFFASIGFNDLGKENSGMAPGLWVMADFLDDQIRTVVFFSLSVTECDVGV